MLNILKEQIKANRNKFGEDPFGYSALAWCKWAMVQNISGFPVDPEKAPNSDDLKSPVLWLTQARAMSEAGVAVLTNEPAFNQVPDMLKGVCDSQYCAVGLMLVGFSLEICLKAMLIMRLGITTFSDEEKKHHHHRLEQLSYFVPNLSEKDKTILRILTHFIVWAGRYPDPGSGRENKAEEIFAESEKYKICAHDLFDLSLRIMDHSKQVVGEL